MAVEAEDREPLVRVLADPDQAAREGGEVEPLGQTRRRGAFGDHRDIGSEGEQRLELAMEGHGAVPGDEAHQPWLTCSRWRRPCSSTWPMTASITTVPPISAWGETVSPKASQTQSGASGVSSAPISAVSDAGIRREPMVKRVSPRLIWTKPKRAR